MTSTSNKGVKSVDTMFDIVETLRRLNGAGITDVADELGLAKSTVHAHLATLLRHEYVVAEDGEYRIGLKFMDLGIHARDRLPLSSVGKPILDQVAQETEEMGWLVVEEHGQAVYLRKATGKRAVQTHSRVGKRVHLHYPAAGKAILSALPNEVVRDIVDRHGLPPKTDRTITDLDELFAELDRIRERGVAFNEGEELQSIRAVGVPIVFEGEVLGSISVSGPSKRMTGERFRETLPELLLGAANEIELKLAYQQNQ